MRKLEVLKHKLLKRIRKDRELEEWENYGFWRGEKKKKTMNVPLFVLMQSLDKQITDLYKAYANYSVYGHTAHFKRTIADLRNVAGCLFLKLKEIEE